MTPACSPARCRTARRATGCARRFGDNVVQLDDPYRFPPVLTDYDLYLLGEGKDQRLYDKLGAHPRVMDGVEGIAFVVLHRTRGGSAWSAISISGTRGGIRCACAGSAIGNCSFPHAKAGDHYKFDMIGPHGQHLPLKSDPLAFAAEMRPKTASIVLDETRLPQPRPAPSGINSRSAPISIYEVHLGSWRRTDNNEWLTYRELAEQLPAYVARSRLHPYRIPAGKRASVRRLLGLSADRSLRPDQPLRHRRRISAHLVDACHAQGSASSSTGCPDISPTIRTGSAASTAPRSTSMPIPCKGAISTGAR